MRTLPNWYPSGPISGIVGLVGDSIAFFPSSWSSMAETELKLELQREITLIELAPSPYFLSKVFVLHMNMFARFDENPAMTLQDIKETKRYVRTDAQTHTRTDRRTT